MARITRLSGNGSHVDDAAPLLAGHHRHHRVQEIEGALHVHGNHGVPLAFAHAHHQAVLGNTGVIYKNVDMPKIRHHLGNHLLRLLKVCRVGGIALHGHAKGFQLRNGLLGNLVDFQVRKGNGCAF